MCDKIKKPLCACGLEMQVIHYMGYYDEFKYFHFHPKCTCEGCKDPDLIEPDVVEHGQFA